MYVLKSAGGAGYVATIMPNVSPVIYDKPLQVRTDEVFREHLEALKSKHGLDASAVVREAVREKFERDVKRKPKAAAKAR